MPKRILIIGILFCLFGTFAIWDVLSDLPKSHINLNFGVFSLPVGIGLLRGKASSQWWARFWIILGYIACGLAIVVATLNPDSAKATFFGESLRGAAALPLCFAMVIVAAAIFYAIHRLLYSEPANAYFHRAA